MPHPNRMIEIEHEFGEPRETLLPRILNEAGTMEAAAKILGISVRNLTEHCTRLGIEREYTYAIRKPEHATE